MTNKKRYFKILADATIPLLGYFLWNWSIYFIFLFYSLDLIAREILTYFKARKIDSNQSNTRFEKSFSFGLMSALILIFVIALMHLISFNLIPNINFLEQTISFMTYSDMGIQQGYILLPLIAFAAFAEYKSEFILPQKFLKITISELWKSHIRSSVYLIFLGLTVLGLSFFMKNHQWLILLMLVLSLGSFQLISSKTNV